MIISIAGAQSRCGVTTHALELALIASMSGKKTLLIECNETKPLQKTYQYGAKQTYQHPLGFQIMTMDDDTQAIKDYVTMYEIIILDCGRVSEFPSWSPTFVAAKGMQPFIKGQYRFLCNGDADWDIRELADTLSLLAQSKTSITNVLLNLADVQRVDQIQRYFAKQINEKTFPSNDQWKGSVNWSWKTWLEQLKINIQ